MFCGHEYTAANLRFALTVEPANPAALEYRDSVAAPARRRQPEACRRGCLSNVASIRFCAATTPACAPAPKRTPGARCASLPRFSACCVPGRTSSVSGTDEAAMITRASLRIPCIVALALALGACAHQPTAAPRERIEAPPSTGAAAPPAERPQPGDGSHALARHAARMAASQRRRLRRSVRPHARRVRASKKCRSPRSINSSPGSSTIRNISSASFSAVSAIMYHVVTEVEARGMPLEFALLPVVESAYEPFAYSVSRAAGLWQFIPATGVRFGLKQDWWYDGRRDVIESTRAALDYLQALHDQFDGDWLLAIAAYNVGEAGVQRAIDYNRALGRPTDFWHLNLPAETRAYVPKLARHEAPDGRARALRPRICADPERAVFRRHRYRLADRLEGLRTVRGHELRRTDRAQRRVQPLGDRSRRAAIACWCRSTTPMRSKRG